MNELDEWEEDIVKDIIEDYPNLLDMSTEELMELSNKWFWEANSKQHEVYRLENYAEIAAKLAKRIRVI